jgi:hypothetical protein
MGMKKFVLLHYGFETPTQEIMDAWNDWFASLGDKLVENCGPFLAGREITHAETRDLPLDREAITGFSIIQAEDLDHATEIAQGCPSITGIRVYQVGSM